MSAPHGRRFTFALQTPTGTPAVASGRADPAAHAQTKAWTPPVFEVVELRGSEGISQLYRFELVLMSTWQPASSAEMQQVLDQHATLRIFVPAGYPDTMVPEQPDKAHASSEGLPYHGRLAEFAYLQSGAPTEANQARQNFYRAVLVPRLWELGMHRRSRVFVAPEQTLPGILAQVLEEALPGAYDITQLLQEVAPNGESPTTGAPTWDKKRYPVRPYVCQYQESTLDFLSRWLERLGIYHYFEHEDGQSPAAEKLVLLDQASVEKFARAPQIEEQAGASIAMVDLRVQYEAHGPTSTGIHPRAVQAFARCLRPGAAGGARLGASQRNFIDTEAGKAPQVGRWPSAGGEEATLAEQLYGDGFLNTDEGNHYAQVRTEAMTGEADRFQGESTVVGLRSGKRIHFGGHFMNDLNGTYLVTEIVHEGQQHDLVHAFERNPYREGGTFYRNRFVAMAAGQQYRAPRRTPWPRIAGTLSAVIQDESAEGKKGSQGKLPAVTDDPRQYAQMDAQGRYWVRMPFDVAFDTATPTKGSAPVRMATPYAGSNHGMHLPLLRGTEVLLAFMGGDPDQPVIVGAVPNSLNPSVVNDKKAALNRLLTAGGNELVLDDTKGKEAVWLYSPANASMIGIGAPGGAGTLYTQKMDQKEAEKKAKDSDYDVEAHDKDMPANTGLLLASDGVFKQLAKTAEEVVHGTKFEAAVGNSTGVNLGFSTNLNWGASVGINGTAGVSWNLDPTLIGSVVDPDGKSRFKGIRIKSLSIDDTDALSYAGKSGGSVALDNITFSAGAQKLDPNYLSLEFHQGVMRTAIGAYVGLTLATQAALNNQLEAVVGKVSPEKWNDAERIALGAIQPTLTTAFVIGMQGWGRTLAARLADVTKVMTTKMTMGAAGFAQTVNAQVDKTKSPNAIRSGIGGAVTSGITLRSSTAEGWSSYLKHASHAVLRLRPESGKGKALIDAGAQVNVTSPLIEMVAKGAAPKKAESILNGAKDTLKHSTSAATLSMTGGDVTLEASSIKIGKGVNIQGPLVAALEAQLDAAQKAFDDLNERINAQEEILASDSDASDERRESARAESAVLLLSAIQSLLAIGPLRDQLASARQQASIDVTNGLLVDGTGTQVVHNLAHLKASGQNLELGYGGVSIQLANQGIDLNGPLIKLG